MKVSLAARIRQKTKFLFKKSSSQTTIAKELYSKIVAHSRQEVFYLEYGVPDTIDGRFELIVFHAFLIMDRLKKNKTAQSRHLSQALFDEMFANFDVNLREMGVGDMGMGKKIKHMIQSFYGRAEAYSQAFQKGEKGLQECFVRNLYGTIQAIELCHVNKMIDYATRQIDYLDKLSDSKLLSHNLHLERP